MLVCFLIIFFSPLYLLHLYFRTMFLSTYQNVESTLKITINFIFFFQTRHWFCDNFSSTFYPECSIFPPASLWMSLYIAGRVGKYEQFKWCYKGNIAANIAFHSTSMKFTTFHFKNGVCNSVLQKEWTHGTIK